MLEESGPRLGIVRELLTGIGRGGQRHSLTRAHEIHSDQPDDERQRRHDLEVNDRLEGEAADPLHVVSVPGYSDHQRSEDERHDDRFDHPQEHSGQRLERNREGRGEHTHEDSDHHRDQYPRCQGNSTEGLIDHNGGKDLCILLQLNGCEVAVSVHRDRGRRLDRNRRCPTSKSRVAVPVNDVQCETNQKPPPEPHPREMR